MEQTGSKKARLASLLSGLVIVAAAAVGGYFWWSGKQPQTVVGPVEKVTIAYAQTPLASLVAIARDQGFFTGQGINATIKEFKGGKQALVDGLLVGEANIATVADMPIAANSFNHNDFKIMATIGFSDNEGRIIARKDSGISQPEDLRGKHIATKSASSSHYFLHLFLLNNGLADNDVTLSFKKSGSLLIPLLASGEIDAFSHREPFIGKAKTLLGDNAVTFESPGLYRKTFNLVASDGFVKDHSIAVERVIAALVEAEKFVKEHPDQTIKIIAISIGSSESAISAIWPDINLSVVLDQGLFFTLEDEARWMIKSNFTDATEVPNYSDYIYIDALESVKPEAVTIIR